MLEENVAVMQDRMLIVNTRPLGYEIYLDPVTDRELVFHHGYLTEARSISVNRTRRAVEFALQGKPGFCVEYVSNEDYEAFNKAFNDKAHKDT